MDDLIVDLDTTEISVTVKRTVQIREYEPLTVQATLKKSVPYDEAKSFMRESLLDVEEQVYEFLGIKIGD